MVAFLAPYAEGVWHWFGLQATLAVLSIVAGLATPALAAVAIDQAVEGRIAWGFIGLAGAMAASALIGTLRGPVASRFGVPLGGRLTRRTVAHALDIGLPGRRPFDDGDLLNRAGSLASQMPGYASTVVRVGTGLAMVAGSLAALLFIHWLFVAVWLVGVSLLALLARRFMAVLSTEQSAYEELNGRMVNAYSDALAGRRTIRAAGTVDREVERVTQPLPALAETTRSILGVMGRAAVVMASADTGVLVATAVAGIWLLAQGDLTPGALLAAVRYAQMAYGNAAGVFDNGWFHIALLRSQAARLMELAATPAMKQGAREAPAEGSLLARGTPSRSPAEGSFGDIQLANVSVRGEADDILRGVNLCIPAVRPSLSLAFRALGKRRWRPLSVGFTIPTKARCGSMACRCPHGRPRRWHNGLRTHSSRRPCSAIQCGTRSRWAMTRAMPRSKRLPEAWRRTRSSGGCRTATTRHWMRRRCREENGKGWV